MTKFLIIQSESAILIIKIFMIKEMINPNFSVDEIASRFFNYLSGKIGEFTVAENMEQMSGGWEAYLYKFRVSG